MQVMVRSDLELLDLSDNEIEVITRASISFMADINSSATIMPPHQCSLYGRHTCKQHQYCLYRYDLAGATIEPSSLVHR
jgi:hypothetical protein